MPPLRIIIRDSGLLFCQNKAPRLAGSSYRKAGSAQIALVQGIERAQSYADNSKAPATRRGYPDNWRLFEKWCLARGLESLPATPQPIAVYIADMAVAHKPATVGRHMAAIASAHKARGFESPCSMRHGAVPRSKRRSGTWASARTSADAPCDHLRLVHPGPSARSPPKNRVRKPVVASEALRTMVTSAPPSGTAGNAESAPDLCG